MTSTIFRSGAEKVCDSAHGRTGNSNDDNELQDSGPFFRLYIRSKSYIEPIPALTEQAQCKHVWGAWTYSEEQPDGLVYLWRKCYTCPATQVY